MLEDSDFDSTDTMDCSWTSAEDVVDEVCLVWGVTCEPLSIDGGAHIGIVGYDPVGTEYSHC